MPKKHISPHLAAVLLAVLVTVFWSSSWVLIKIVLRGSLPPLTFAGIRYTFAFVILIPFIYASPARRRELHALNRRQWVKLMILGLISYALTQGAMFLALDKLPANTLSLLLNLTSVFVAISGIFLLREFPSMLQWLGILLAVGGVIVYFFPITLPSSQILGIAFGLFCMMMNVISSLLSRAVNRHASISPIIVTFVSIGFGSVLMLCAGFVAQGFGTPTWQEGLIIIWLAVVNTALAFTLWNRTLQYLTAVESSVLNSLMLPQIAFLAYIFLGEGVSLRDVVGLVLVGIGTIIVHLKYHKSSKI